MNWNGLQVSGSQHRCRPTNSLHLYYSLLVSETAFYYSESRSKHARRIKRWLTKPLANPFAGQAADHGGRPRYGWDRYVASCRLRMLG
jgi:hypothetical protein